MTMEKDIQSLLKAGFAHHQAGCLAEAEKHYTAVLELAAHHADALYLRGTLAFQQGRHKKAVRDLRASLKFNPANALAWNNLGNVHKQQGEVDQALQCYAQALALNPQYPEAVHNWGAVLQEQGKLDQAVDRYGHAIALNPGYAEAHYNLANVLKAQGKEDEAIAAYGRALALRPDHFATLFSLASVLQNQGRLDDAIALYGRALQLRPADPVVLNNLGNAYLLRGRAEQAVECYGAALAVAPGLADAHYNLGNALTELGHMDQAFAAYERALAAAPRRGAFYRMLAETGRLTPDNPHVVRLQELALTMSDLPESEQMELHFALGMALGQNPQSFDHVLAANALARRHVDYDEAAVLAQFERVKAIFNSDFMASLSGTQAFHPLPVFVVGMPRSGTTLVEQILSSHSRVFGAGELPDFPQVMDGLDPLGFPDAIPFWGVEQLDRLGKAYANRLRAYAPQAMAVVDKLPDNFLRIGLIHMALPSAKIIHVRRDPVDTCLSCFAKLFRGPVPYGYDLAELGRYYRAYDNLMEHWRQTLPPGVLFEIHYEDIVRDATGQIRRLLAHCGLDWEDACRDFHQTRRVVQTASAAQVRQPLYNTSIGRWHGCGDLVRPLMDALQGGRG